MKSNKKFLSLYNQIKEEIATYLEKDSKLTHGEKSSFGTTGSAFGTTGSSMYNSSNDNVNSGNAEGSDSMSTESIKNPPPKDIKAEDAGMTAMSVMGPTSPDQSLANTASTGNSMNVQHDDAGLTTADLKPIYCPAIPYGYKRKKIKIDKRTFK